MVKRIIALIICVLMVLFLAACGEQGTYDQAAKLLEEGNYSEALEMFKKIPDYKDSADKISECEKAVENESAYKEAVSDMESERYEEAAEAFLKIKDYKDSADKATECQYKNAMELLKSNKFKDAKKIFDSIPDYTAKIVGFDETLTQMNTGLLALYVTENGVLLSKMDNEFKDNTSILDENTRCLSKEYKDSEGNTYKLLVTNNSDSQMMLYYFRKYTKDVDDIGEVDCVDEYVLPITTNRNDSPFAIVRSFVVEDGENYYVELFMSNLWNEGTESDPSYDMATVSKDTKWLVTDFEDKVDKEKTYASDSEEVKKMSADFSYGANEILKNADDLIKDSGVTLKGIGFKKL